MNLLRVIVVVMVLLEGGFMVFDGAHALITGDYYAADSAAVSGDGLPWGGIVASVGIAPHSAGMKWFFVVYGTAWVASAAAFSIGARWAWWALILAAAGSLWYLNVGAGLSLAQLVLLMAPQLRS